MAKSKSFFGLRRGSTKSMTFQVLNGAQITKDRVVDVKNPRTRTQMVQRMIMATAGSAYKHMREIVDHSFEGVSYGQRSYSGFMRLNVHDMVEDVRGNLGQFSYNPYGDTELYASPFILSRGSLKNPNQILSFTMDLETLGIYHSYEQIDLQATSLNDFWDKIGVQIGDMLTVCLIYRKETESSFQFSWIRMLIEKGSDSNLYDINVNEYVSIQSPLGKSFFNVEEENFGIEVEFNADDIEEIYGTTILSRKSNNRWLRSNAQIIFPGSPVNSPTAAEALATYPIGTDYILNGANIGGGGGITPETRLRMVTRLPNGAPMYTSASDAEVVATFNRDFSLDELDGKLQMVFYDMNNNTAVLLDRTEIDTESQKVRLFDSMGNYQALQIEGRSLIFSDESNEGYIFDIDYNHQHRRERTIQNGNYLMQLPSLASDSNILPVVQITNSAHDFDFIVNSIDGNNGYKPVCRNANGEFVTDEWFTNEEGETAIGHIRSILELVLVMEFGGETSDYAIGGFVSQPAGDLPLINLLN